ncbi:DAZ-associated protein 1 isoform X4 [Amblyraja radiata]|uniref:DAZ-associated protein 1 isoform X4 n=1 Tax=Amblyraja radiata TaxID=386614 RepID=UPI0014034F91|nr:DAZ-associated protein 1 isoform X4 [Amblyraja radiata]XP_055514933.1 DAZ-associated protein 1 isoform X4 [Leucoraja erinacea]
MNNQGGDEIGKLFVGGLDWNTTQETLRDYFSQYGEVVDCVIMKDKMTNQSRGFGFVKFKDPNCVGTVLASRPHNLDGRTIDPKPCTPRSMQQEKPKPKEGGGWGKSSQNQSSNKSKKVFVGGIPHNCSETELRDYFKRFGVVSEVVMIYDAEKQRPRGFGFITFEDEQSVDQAVNMHYHDIMGKKVEVKRAEPRDSKTPGSGQSGAPQWTRSLPNAANGWGGQPSQGWQQQSYGSPQGMWMAPGQPMGGYGPPPPPGGRGAPPQPPHFNPYVVPQPPPGGFAPPQGFGQGFGAPPQYGYGQDMSGFGQAPSFSDPNQPAPSYGGPSAPAPPGAPPSAPGGFARGQNHNAQGFHPYRR